MKFLYLSLAICGLLSCSKNDTEQPNVIYIMADDLGYGDVGVYGQKLIQTPNIDKLASEGMLFTRHYAGNTVCAPSRCTLMTGLHNGHARIRGNKRTPLLDEDITVAEVFKKAGYSTNLVGKWGLGEEGSTGIPNNQGFDYFYGYLNQAHAHNYYPAFLYENEKRDSLGNIVETMKEGNSSGIAGHSSNKLVYSHDLFEKKALEVIKNNKDKPFFLYLALTLPHANNEAQHFNESGMEIPSLGIYEKEDWPEDQKRHAAMITRLDLTVGLVIQKLIEEGIDENTIVIFTSDNGPHNEGGADSEFFNSNGPLRGTKRDLYEGGIRVPTIARWPGKIKAGSKTEHVSGFVDFFATIIELVIPTEKYATDGQSYLPVLLGKKETSNHDFYWEFHEQGGKQAVLFDTNWKCIRLNVNDSTKTNVELYNLATDIEEQNNVASDFPEKLAKGIKLIDENHVYNADFHFNSESR
jgi:arylsulfatase A-like enzyme